VGGEGWDEFCEVGHLGFFLSFGGGGVLVVLMKKVIWNVFVNLCGIYLLNPH